MTALSGNDNVAYMVESVAFTTTANRSEGGSRVLSRALDVLLAFAGPEDDLGVSEIARKLSLDKAQVYRYLSALREKGFVSYKANTHRYFLGMGILQLSQIIERQFDLITAVTPYLERMRDISGETCGLATQVGTSRTHLLQAESQHEICQRFQIGASLPIYLGAAGLCLLAFSEGDVEQILTRDNNFPLNAKELRRSLADTREAGYGSSLGQRIPGSRSVAVPVWSSRGDLFALVISGPSFRFSEDKVQQVIPYLKKCASELTTQLGGSKFMTKWSLKEE